VIFIIVFIAWWLISLIPPFIIKKKLRNLKGLTIAPFIFVTNRHMTRSEWIRLIKHEKEHIKQQRRYSPVLFLIIYCTEYLIYRAKGMEHYEAYWNITFEKQAREAEKE
jgi:hypothetical protein